MNDTIVGISTALGVSAINIIRLSGSNSIEISNRIFSGNLLNKDSHTITYGFIKDENKKIDEVLVTIMKSPKSYTTEDVVEISCHGGIATTNKIIELLIKNGARIAEPGEFTKRAFLNGRIDLNQAEGIMDLIEAKTDKARDAALKRVEGSVSKLIKILRSDIVNILANIEVNIDFPEYEDAVLVTNKIIKEKTNEFEIEINKILKETEESKIIKEGIKTAIIGRPNVGKSSILNLLLEEEKAIVTEIAGTTRDIVEGNIIIQGIIFNIIDTAGIRKTDDLVESIGVNKSEKLIEDAELILLIFNNNEKLTIEDKELLEKTKNKTRLIIVNKSDLDSQIEKEFLEKYIEISALNNSGLNKIKEEISNLLNLSEIKDKDYNYIINSREKGLLKQVLEIIKDINQALQNEIPVDMLEIDIKRIWDILGEIIGESYNDELIDQLFTNFCLGK